MYKSLNAIRRGLAVLITITGLTFFSATPGLAIPVTFEFEFAGVTGTILGLSDNVNDQEASSINVLLPDGSQFEPVEGFSGFGVIPINNFSVENGSFTAVDFQVNSFGGIGLFLLSLTTGTSFIFIGTEDFFKGPISFTNVTPTVSAVPLPPALVLFLTGLIGLGALTRRRKSQVVA